MVICESVPYFGNASSRGSRATWFLLFVSLVSLMMIAVMIIRVEDIHSSNSNSSRHRRRRRRRSERRKSSFPSPLGCTYFRNYHHAADNLLLCIASFLFRESTSLALFNHTPPQSPHCQSSLGSTAVTSSSLSSSAAHHRKAQPPPCIPTIATTFPSSVVDATATKSTPLRAVAARQPYDDQDVNDDHINEYDWNQSTEFNHLWKKEGGDASVDEGNRDAATAAAAASSYDSYQSPFAAIRATLDSHFHSKYHPARQRFQDSLILSMLEEATENNTSEPYAIAAAQESSTSTSSSSSSSSPSSIIHRGHSNKCTAADSTIMLKEHSPEHPPGSRLSSLSSSLPLPPSPHPWIVFSAGAMGAGKSWTVKRLQEKGVFPLNKFVAVDPDAIRHRLPEYPHYLHLNPSLAGEHTRKECGMVAEILVKASLERGRNVLVDGSLRNATWYANYFKELRRDYPNIRIAIFHVTAPREKIMSRALNRSKVTGRVVPAALLEQTIVQVPVSYEQLRPFVDFAVELRNAKDKEKLEDQQQQEGGGGGCVVSNRNDDNENNHTIDDELELYDPSGKMIDWDTFRKFWAAQVLPVE